MANKMIRAIAKKLADGSFENIDIGVNGVNVALSNGNDLEFELKSNYYTQDEIDSFLNALTILDIQVVTALPTENISTTTIYLVGTNTIDNQNDYEEWIYTSEDWEMIGTTKVDLTNYYTKTEVDDLLNDTYIFNVASDDWYGLTTEGDSFYIDGSLYSDIERILNCNQVYIKVPGSDYPIITYIFNRQSNWNDTEAYFTYYNSPEKKVYQLDATVDTINGGAWIYIRLMQDGQNNGDVLTLTDPQPYEEIV